MDIGQIDQSRAICGNRTDVRRRLGSTSSRTARDRRETLRRRRGHVRRKVTDSIGQWKRQRGSAALYSSVCRLYDKERTTDSMKSQPRMEMAKNIVYERT